MLWGTTVSPVTCRRAMSWSPILLSSVHHMIPLPCLHHHSRRPGHRDLSFHSTSTRTTRARDVLCLPFLPLNTSHKEWPVYMRVLLSHDTFLSFFHTSTLCYFLNTAGRLFTSNHAQLALLNRPNTLPHCYSTLSTGYANIDIPTVATATSALGP